MVVKIVGASYSGSGSVGSSSEMMKLGRKTVQVDRTESRAARGDVWRKRQVMSYSATTKLDWCYRHTCSCRSNMAAICTKAVDTVRYKGSRLEPLEAEPIVSRIVADALE